MPALVYTPTKGACLLLIRVSIVSVKSNRLATKHCSGGWAVLDNIHREKHVAAVLHKQGCLQCYAVDGTINLQHRASIDFRKAGVFMGGWIVTVAECSALLA